MTLMADCDFEKINNKRWRTITKRHGSFTGLLIPVKPPFKFDHTTGRWFYTGKSQTNNSIMALEKYDSIISTKLDEQKTEAPQTKAANPIDITDLYGIEKLPSVVSKNESIWDSTKVNPLWGFFNENLANRRIMDENLNTFLVKFGREKKQSEFSRHSRLHVSNIPFTYMDKDLKLLFEPYGNVIDYEVIYNSHGSKGFGFVTFSTQEAAEKAKNHLNNQFVSGRKITVSWATARHSQRSLY